GEGAVHTAKSRYRQADSTCQLTRVEDDELSLEFSEPHWAVTPGQSVVVYDGSVCLGGGVIA
ncbi:MAG: aminomethyltransferase beta-barrel domain-containing protein, partial [Betaproteobacteria bacterium]